MSETESNTTQDRNGPAPILVATDFSPDSEAALIWACEFAARIDAPILVAHVVHDPADAAGFYQSDESDAREPMYDVAGKMMTKFMGGVLDANPDLASLQSATTELVVGLPPGRIVEIAEREGAQLIAIGSRGRTGLTHLLVGSVAERVAHLAPMPVVIVKRKAGN